MGLVRVVIIPGDGLDEETKALMLEKFENGESCRWCGGLHQQECPRLKHVIYHPSDERQIREVEFWPDDQWDRSSVLFPRDVV